MWLKKKKYEILSKSIEKLNKTLEEGNFVELAYLLGNKKDMFFRNLFAGIFRGIGIRYRCYCNYSCFGNVITKDCDIKYSCYWRIYCRYCRNCGEK